MDFAEFLSCSIQELFWLATRLTITMRYHESSCQELKGNYFTNRFGITVFEFPMLYIKIWYTAIQIAHKLISYGFGRLKFAKSQTQTPAPFFKTAPILNVIEAKLFN